MKKNENTDLQQYQSPTLTDYGKMSELTQALPAPGAGSSDGTYPSYTIATS